MVLALNPRFKTLHMKNVSTLDVPNSITLVEIIQANGARFFLLVWP
jgi:hypothetical protein